MGGGVWWRFVVVVAAHLFPIEFTTVKPLALSSAMLEFLCTTSGLTTSSESLSASLGGLEADVFDRI